MKTLYRNYKLSKFKPFINGVIFAFLAIPFFIWGVMIILKPDHACIELIYPLIGIILCIILGSHSMFKEKTSRKSAGR